MARISLHFPCKNAKTAMWMVIPITEKPKYHKNMSSALVNT
jgi:hypothetical protein